MPVSLSVCLCCLSVVCCLGVWSWDRDPCWICVEQVQVSSEGMRKNTRQTDRQTDSRRGSGPRRPWHIVSRNIRRQGKPHRLCGEFRLHCSGVFMLVVDHHRPSSRWRKAVQQRRGSQDGEAQGGVSNEENGPFRPQPHLAFRVSHWPGLLSSRLGIGLGQSDAQSIGRFPNGDSETSASSLDSSNPISFPFPLSLSLSTVLTA